MEGGAAFTAVCPWCDQHDVLYEPKIASAKTSAAVPAAAMQTEKPVRRSARERVFNPKPALDAMPRTAYNRDLYELFILADQLSDKIAEFVDTHDSDTVAMELVAAGAATAADVRDPAFIEEVLYQVDHVTGDADGFRWSLEMFTSIVEGFAIKVDLEEEEEEDEEENAPASVVTTGKESR